MKDILIFFCILTLLTSKIENPEEITIEVNIDGYSYHEVGAEEGKFGINSQTQDVNDFFNIDDIQENTHFNYNIISKDDNTYPLDCKLWKDERKDISIICGLKTNLIKDEERFQINDTLNIEYNSKKVNINLYVEEIVLRIKGEKIPFIYSSLQEINITENQKMIDIKFNYDMYNNEPLCLYQDLLYLYLDNCKKVDSKILNCQIPKEKLDIYALKENTFGLFSYNTNTGYFNQFNLVKPIKINYPDIIKEDINLSLVNLTNKEIGNGGFITFETNITNMDKIKTGIFIIDLSDDIQYVCNFIKHDSITPLYMTCSDKRSRNYTFEEIGGFNQSNIHYKYNFILPKQRFNETVTFLKKVSGWIVNIYPETLDFSNKDENILYISSDFANIRLNVEAEDLKCEERKEVRICTVPKSHFKNKENGNYLIHYKIKENEYITSYEYFGVDVTLSSSLLKINQYSLGLFAFIYLLLLF